jgi:hypothetical protein
MATALLWQLRCGTAAGWTSRRRVRRARLLAAFLEPRGAASRPSSQQEPQRQSRDSKKRWHQVSGQAPVAGSTNPPATIAPQHLTVRLKGCASSSEVLDLLATYEGALGVPHLDVALGTLVRLRAATVGDWRGAGRRDSRAAAAPHAHERSWRSCSAGSTVSQRGSEGASPAVSSADVAQVYQRLRRAVLRLRPGLQPRDCASLLGSLTKLRPNGDDEPGRSSPAGAGRPAWRPAAEGRGARSERDLPAPPLDTAALLLTELLRRLVRASHVRAVVCPLLVVLHDLDDDEAFK